MLHNVVAVITLFCLLKIYVSHFGLSVVVFSLLYSIDVLFVLFGWFFWSVKKLFE